MAAQLNALLEKVHIESATSYQSEDWHAWFPITPVSEEGDEHYGNQNAFLRQFVILGKVYFLKYSKL